MEGEDPRNGSLYAEVTDTPLAALVLLMSTALSIQKWVELVVFVVELTAD